MMQTFSPLSVVSMPPSAARRRRAAFSLIEVVAATIILGLLASSLILASGRMRKHEALMQRKRQAVELADRLAGAHTITPGQDGQMAWTVTRVGAPALLDTGIDQYHLAIHAIADPDAELTSVDFLVPDRGQVVDGGRWTAEGGRP